MAPYGKARECDEALCGGKKTESILHPIITRYPQTSEDQFISGVINAQLQRGPTTVPIDIEPPMFNDPLALLSIVPAFRLLARIPCKHVATKALLKVKNWEELPLVDSTTH